MSLLKTETATAAATIPAFEDDKATVTFAQPAETKAASAVAAKPAGAAVVERVELNALDSLKDVMRVEYNTLDQVIASNGNFMDRETKVVLGDTVVFSLLSWQDAFVVSPEDDDAPDDVVRYSDDGIVCNDGVTVADALAEMKLTYPKAKVKQRAVVVGAIESSSKVDSFNNKPVQFDLSPASRTQWKRYMAQAAYSLHIKKLSPEQVKRIKATTRVATGAGNNTYTLAQFATAE